MWRSLAFLALFSISGAAYAEGFDYNFIQGSYGKIDFDDLDVDGDGFGIGGSAALSDRVHVFGSYEKTSLDFDIDVSEWQAGVGFNTPVSDKVDVIASLAYVSEKVDVSGLGSDDENGYGLGVGLRAMPSPELEVDGGISYVDLGGDSDSDTAFNASFLYNFTENFAAGLSGQWSDDVNQYALNGRFYFGN